jgi:glucokinase
LKYNCVLTQNREILYNRHIGETVTAIGIDFGGTKIAFDLYDIETWAVRTSATIPTPAEDDFAHILDLIGRQIETMREDRTMAVGIGVPGLVRQPEGIVVTMPNVKDGKDVEMREQLEKYIKLPVTVDNDANCFTLAEAIRGRGKGNSVVVGLTLGTGVGGGIVIGNRLFHGSHGFAAEVGHMLLRPGEPPFETDDKRGDVEQFFSGSALGRRCKQAESPEDYLEGETCSFLHDDIFREVAWTCVNLIHVIDPSIIILGGSAGRAMGPHLKTVEQKINEWVLPGTPIPSLAIAQLPNAATLGAAILTQERCIS